MCFGIHCPYRAILCDGYEFIIIPVWLPPYGLCSVYDYNDFLVTYRYIFVLAMMYHEYVPLSFHFERFGFCLLGDTVTKYGVNPTITFSSGKGIVKSPLLLWSDKTSYMKFRYEESIENPHLQVTNDILCYSDVGGLIQITSWQNSEATVTAGYGCFGVVDIGGSDVCKTFRVKTTIEFTAGEVAISDIEFGDQSLCSDTNKIETLDCKFENSDCGIRNDACGLVDWEIRSDSETGRRRRSTECYQQSGVPLLKKRIHKKCSYDNLRIADLQPSGFSFIEVQSDATSLLADSIKSRRRRSSGYSLYLDPSQVSGVAIGVLDLPEVQHAVTNAFMTFAYDMDAGGYHDLMVTAVCTSDPANSLVPLGSGSVHYKISNLDGSGSSGTICLDIHAYVLAEECSTFVMQLQGAAIGTVLVVDDFFFLENLASTGCSK